MATAVETSSKPRTPTPAGLAAASLVGAAYIVAALAVVVYAVPLLWAEYVAPQISNPWMNWGSWRLAQVAAALGLALFGRVLVGSNPPRGLRGGIFLMIVALVVIFFVVRAVGLSAEGNAGKVVAGVAAAGLLFGAYRLFSSPRGERWMVGLEEQGWFHSSPYKRALGQRVRRLTILGILLVGGSGVWSLHNAGTLPENWTITVPFTQVPGAPDGTLQTFTVLPDTKYSVPLLLMGLTLWVAYRAVNMPMFAEFLIATEAEMNKVSWSTRRRLTQDTAVVLITTILMTLFLFFVDIFWGWLLSRETVGVLPGNSTTKDKAGQVQEAKW